ncbi:unnamed protein product [Rotaria socialis]|uniref:G-protein coupled receptors family 1 profile domain-containing protein n=1 Tax=Rotaria socialis TaxID=392032 RepID=A0A818F3U0_9BILA|nr:unnamed protein product [Rotaria socialis]CAF3468838.1 unnamed protein product [Rotaria socialis]CAF3629843.1 unnamed protein product [Rotaria socialis]CAF3704823.1 unnamed protein product [Rotaria socialis]CAF3732187.1 unnamed protein product [Rotaria socialis]
MPTTTANKIINEQYTQIDLSTTTLSTFAANRCENQTQSPLDEIQDRINVVVPYLVILGTIGNGLSVITFSQRSLRTVSCGCYLLLLSICDTIGLLIMSRPYFFKRLDMVHHLNSSLFCGLHLFLTKIFDELTPWLLVFVACNRLVLSRYPRNDQCFQTARAALWSTLCLLILIICINLHLLFGIGVGYSPSQPCTSVCGPLTNSPSYLFFYKNVSPIIDLFISLIIPFCIIFIANIFILVNVRRVKKQATRIRHRKRANRNARLNIVLLADLITFIVATLPVLSVECIYRFTRTIERAKQFDQNINIAWVIANKFFYLNYSLSFYCYVLTSSYFRHHFLLAIGCNKLNNAFFTTTQNNRQRDPTSDFTAKYGNRLSSASKSTVKCGNSNSLHVKKKIVRSSEDSMDMSNAINEMVPLRERQVPLTILLVD